MYVVRVNWLVMEFCVVENASTGDDICGKVVGIVGGAGGARGPVGESGDNSSDREDVINPKKGLIVVALKRVTTMVEGAPKDNSSVPREATAAATAKKGSSGPIRAVAVAQ